METPISSWCYPGRSYHLTALFNLLPTHRRALQLPQYSCLQRKLPTGRRDLSATLSLSVLGTVILFLLLFLLGAEPSLSSSLSHSPFAFYTYHRPLLLKSSLTPVEHDLHHFHTIPLRYLRVLPSAHQQTLLSLLATPPSPLIPKRRAIFAHVTARRLQASLRAIASVAAFARATERIAVIFVQAPFGIPISQTIELPADGLLTPEAIVVPVDTSAARLLQEAPHLQDWAEFSVAEAVAPNQLPNTSLSTAIVPSSQDPSTEADEARLPRIGNTNHLGSLDALAALDTHVSVTLSEVIWTNYAPRTIQESILATAVSPLPHVPPERVPTASLLGRYKHTRDIESVDRMLYNSFNIPRMLIAGMDELARRLLLLKLLSKRRKGIKFPRVLFVHTQYGLGNRLRALGSAMAFARRSDRVLVLIWVADSHLDCRYTDLFVASDEFVVADDFKSGEEWPFAQNKADDPKMQHVVWYNFMRHKGVQANTPDQEIANPERLHLYVSTCYVILSKVTPFIIRTQSTFWNVLRCLTPHVDVARLIERFAAYPMSNMIGVHIRGKPIAKDIEGVSAADYSAESSRRTDYWRNLTQMDAFVEEMKRQAPDQLFYVAADQTSVLMQLEKEFPGRVFYTARNCDSRDKECLPFALADILLLAQCRSLRGSYWSSFSELSVRFGGARFLLAGIDFGRPRTAYRRN